MMELKWIFIFLLLVLIFSTCNSDANGRDISNLRRKLLRQKKRRNASNIAGKRADSRDSNNRRNEQYAYAQSRPNILLILADDVGTGDIPVYWNSSLVDMPHLDRLASMGVTFMDAHSTPLCAPSRYMLLSGNYAHRGARPNGMWGFWRNSNQFRKFEKSIADVLRDEAGYKTSIFGKWHLGAKAPPNGADRFKDDFTTMLTNSKFDWTMPLLGGPEDIGFEKSYITMGGIQQSPYSFFRDGIMMTEPRNIRFWEVGNYTMPEGKSKIIKKGDGDKSWDSTAYNMILVNETEQFVDDHLENNPNDPFFAYVALGAAHVPHSPPKKYLDGSNVEEEYDTRHLDMLLEMDKVVGSLVSIIENRGLEEDTIVIFSTDNGGLDLSDYTGHRTSGPLRGRKGSIYEGGHRVPLIFRYDGFFPPNETRKKLVGLNDIYATICELVGIDIPAGSAQDSVSFANYIKDEENVEGLRTFLGTWAYDAILKIRRQEAIRRGPWKLVHYVENSTYAFYNLKDDISEDNNLIGHERYAAKIRNMNRTLDIIGPCPTNDVKGKFEISQMQNKKRNCQWFKDKKKRCRKFLEGEKNCFSVCGRNKKLCATSLDR